MHQSEREYFRVENFHSGLSHTRRSDASEKRKDDSMSTFGQIRLWRSFLKDFIESRFYRKTLLLRRFEFKFVSPEILFDKKYRDHRKHL